jgi:hypothetical protein
MTQRHETGAVEAIKGPPRGVPPQMQKLQQAAELNQQQAVQEGEQPAEEKPAQGQGAAPQAPLEEDVELSDKAQAELDAQKAQEEEELKAQQEAEQTKEYEEKTKALELQIQQLTAQIEQLLAQGNVEEARPLVNQVAGLENELEQLKATHPGSPAAAEGWTPQPGAQIGGTGGGQQWVPMNLGGNGTWKATPSDAFNNVQANPTVEVPDLGKTGNKKEIGQMLDAAAAKYGIPPDTLKAVAWQESGWNPNAKSFDGQHGKGVMQIDDRYHEFARTQDVFDPKKNIEYGAKYLSSLKDKYGSWQEALHHYNGGSTYAGKIQNLAQQKPWQKYTG